MKCRFIIMCCVLVLMPLTAIAADRQIIGDEAKTLLERIKDNQANLKTISGLFVEQRSVSTMPFPLEFKGKVYAEPPGFLFLSYEEPIQHIMKVSGDTVIFYVADSTTADQVNMENGGQGGAPADLFNWDATSFSGEIVETEQGYLFHNPEMNAGDRQVRITLDKETLMVKSLILQEPGGDITTIEMHDLKVNMPIPEAILNYELPEGVTINSMGQ